VQRKGDDFDRLFREHFPVVVKMLTRALADRSEAEDLAQEAFARLYARWPLSSSDKARPYVYKTAINLLNSHFRNVSRGRRLVPRLWAGGGTDYDGASIGPDMADTVTDRLTLRAALMQLSPRQQACVLLADVAGLKGEDIARTLGVRESTVYVHVHRAHLALRKQLGPVHGEPVMDEGRDGQPPSATV
jgi:RNA polymerase sigma-70 factor (ECF subfamily)